MVSLEVGFAPLLASTRGNGIIAHLIHLPLLLIVPVVLAVLRLSFPSGTVITYIFIVDVGTGTGTGTADV